MSALLNGHIVGPAGSSMIGAIIVRSFSDAKRITALHDQLTDRCHILKTGNDSYRFKASSEAAKTTTKESATLTKA